MSLISMGTAFMAGVLSFISPCVLPLLPAYISYITGTNIAGLKKDNQDSNLKTLKKSIQFVLGFSLVFILLGITATTISQFLLEYKLVLNKIAGLILIILGINLMGIFKIKWFYKTRGKVNIAKLNSNPFLIGLAFGFGWTPCVGPVLAGILVLSSSMSTVLQGMFLLLMYSFGLGIPFILTSLFIEKVIKITKNIMKYSNVILISSGILVIIIGILIFTNNLTKLNSLF